MNYLTYAFGLLVYFLVLVITWVLTLGIACPLMLVVKLIEKAIDLYGLAGDKLIESTQLLTLNKPIAFTFKGAVKAWRKRLADYRGDANYEIKQFAERNLEYFKEGTYPHKNARACLYAFGKAHEDVKNTLNEPCDFDFEEEE